MVGKDCAPGFCNDRDGERTVSKYVKRGFGGALAEEDITEVTDTLRGTFFDTAVSDVERVVAHEERPLRWGARRHVPKVQRRHRCALAQLERRLFVPHQGQRRQLVLRCESELCETLSPEKMAARCVGAGRRGA